MRFAETDVDLADQSGVVEYVFQFRNHGNTTVVIREVRSSCICTLHASPQQTIGPGDGGMIRVTTDLSERPAGTYYLDGSVIYEDPNRCEQRLRVKLHNRPKPPHIVPTELEIVGASGGPLVKTLRFISYGRVADAIVNIEHDCSFITSHSLGIPIWQGGAWIQDIALHFRTDTVGSDKALYVLTMKAKGEVFAVPLRLKMSDRIVVAPRDIVVRRCAQRDNELLADVYLRDREGSPIQIESVLSPASCISAEYVAEPKTLQQIRLRLVGGDMSNMLPIHLEVQLSEPCVHRSIISLLPPLY